MRRTERPEVLMGAQMEPIEPVYAERGADMRGKLARWVTGGAVTVSLIVGTPAVAGAQAAPAPTPKPSRGPVSELLNGLLGLVNGVVAPVDPGDGALLTLGSGESVLGVLPAQATTAVDTAVGAAAQAPALGLDVLGLQVGVLQPKATAASTGPAVVVPEATPATTVPVTPVVPAPSPASAGESGRTDAVVATTPEPALEVLSDRRAQADDGFFAMSSAHDSGEPAARSTVAGVLDLATDPAPIATVFIALAAVMAALCGWSLTRRRGPAGGASAGEGQA